MHDREAGRQAEGAAAGGAPHRLRALLRHPRQGELPLPRPTSPLLAPDAPFVRTQLAKKKKSRDELKQAYDKLTAAGKAKYLSGGKEASADRSRFEKEYHIDDADPEIAAAGRRFVTS